MALGIHEIKNSQIIKKNPKKLFLNYIAENLRNVVNRINPEDAAQKIFDFLEKKISEGEINDIKSELPKPILELWH